MLYLLIRLIHSVSLYKTNHQLAHKYENENMPF